MTDWAGVDNQVEKYRDPIGRRIGDGIDYLIDKAFPQNNINTDSSVPALANTAGNIAAGPTGRTGVGGVKSHSTSWQHKVGGQFGPVGSRIGRFAGRAAVVATVFDGFFDLATIGKAISDNTECVPY